MFKKTIGLIIISSGLLLIFCGEKDRVSPKVVLTNPPNGSEDVDPALTEIWVEFNEPMKDKSWSWCYEKKDQFPKTTVDPYYTDNNTRNVLPVELEPKKEYVIWINTNKLKGFKDKAGNPCKPYKFTFRTK